MKKKTSVAISDPSNTLLDLGGVSDPMDAFPLEKARNGGMSDPMDTFSLEKQATQSKRRSVRSNWIRFPWKKRASIWRPSTHLVPASVESITQFGAIS